MRFTVSKEIKWHMAHRVPHHKSRCKSNHGHTYFLVAEVMGVVDETEGVSDEGMVIDFGDIKTILMDKIYNVLDHASMFWDQDPLVPALEADEGTKLVKVPFIPTAENIAKWCFEQVENDLHIPFQRRLLKITINETPTSAAEYSLVGPGADTDLLNE